MSALLLDVILIILYSFSFEWAAGHQYPFVAIFIVSIIFFVTLYISNEYFESRSKIKKRNSPFNTKEGVHKYRSYDEARAAVFLQTQDLKISEEKLKTLTILLYFGWEILEVWISPNHLILARDYEEKIFSIE